MTAAGGVLAGVDPVSVNLASKLTDGQQLVIGVPGGAGVRQIRRRGLAQRPDPARQAPARQALAPSI